MVDVRTVARAGRLHPAATLEAAPRPAGHRPPADLHRLEMLAPLLAGHWAALHLCMVDGGGAEVGLHGAAACPMAEGLLSMAVVQAAVRAEAAARSAAPPAEGAPV